MSALSSITLKEAIIPLESSFDPDSICTVKVENKWTTGNKDEYYKMYLPVCEDPTKKELFLYVIDQFYDACHEERLHLTTGLERYSKFRLVVDGALKMGWQTISEAQQFKSLDNFAANI